MEDNRNMKVSNKYFITEFYQNSVYLLQTNVNADASVLETRHYCVNINKIIIFIQTIIAYFGYNLIDLQPDKRNAI
ncbi:hypothetical protein C825_005525 [Parabacteroides sp. ASF519]|nr:hypothetical protein C825_005525 [Parabacteroides sp. ASF519]